MDNFVVSARKYRPQNFETVVGQAHITTTLKNAIKSKQLAHAFLFCGPRGVGKTTCARILAKTINCENPTTEGEACNECTSCKTFLEGQSMNIHELDAASNNSVEDIRALTEQVRYSPQSGKYKVYIIDEVHMLSPQAFNAFLKTLEEPPPYAIFILATTEKHKILPTILSRCQVFDFKRMPSSETVTHLQAICEKEKVKSESDALRLIAQKSEGCMRDALSILDKIISFTGGDVTYKNTLEHLNILDYEYFFRVSEAIREQDAGATLLIYDEILQKGFEGDDFLEGYSGFLRELMVCKDKRTLKLMDVSDHLANRYVELAKSSDTGFLVSALNLLNETDIQYKQARNKRLLMEMCLIRLSYLQQAVTLISDEQTGAVSKKKVTDKQNRAYPLRNALPQKISIGKKKTEPATSSSQKEKAAPAEIPIDKDKLPPTGSKNIKNNSEQSAKQESVQTKKSEKPTGGLFNTRDKLDLDTIRDKVNREKEQKTGQTTASKPLEDEILQTLWRQHIQELKQAEKKQAANIMDLATIRIVNEEEVEIICRNSVQLSFIGDQKIELAEKLKNYFHNESLQVSIKVDDSLRGKTSKKAVLTQRQKLEQMMKKYPLVKKMKEGLYLDLG